VRLEGEFAHAGVYSVLPGETLRSLVVRAGGLTDKLSIRSRVHRKSTQLIEAQRLKEYADRLEHQLARSSIAMGTRPTGVRGERTTRTDRRRRPRSHRTAAQVQPTGRIVLDLNPHSAGENQCRRRNLRRRPIIVPPLPPPFSDWRRAHQMRFCIATALAWPVLHLAAARTAMRTMDRSCSAGDGSVTGRFAASRFFRPASRTHASIQATPSCPGENVGRELCASFSPGYKSSPIPWCGRHD